MLILKRMATIALLIAVAVVNTPPDKGGSHGTHLMADYSPPSTIGGPGRTGGQGTRLM